MNRNDIIKKASVRIQLLVVLSIFFYSCKKERKEEIQADQTVMYYDSGTDRTIGTRWADMTLKVIKKAPKNTPTYCSRALGYIGLSMYEAVVYANPGKHSLSSKLNGLTGMPVPDKSKDYTWELSCNAAQAFMLKKMYGYTSESNVTSIDSLRNVIEAELSTSISEEEKRRSIEFGESVANAIFEWSKTDGGHEGYTRNFPAYVFPTVEGAWVANPSNSQSPSTIPLHPYWGENRTFASNNMTMELPEAPTFSNDPNSTCYQQFKEVYDKSLTLTQEQKEIALWWGDDPSHSFSPAGHSYSIGNIVLKSTNLDLVESSELFAKLGMSLSDAFVNCWRCKYICFRERPSAFITRNISSTWLSFWPEPPFPSFISGHSTQGMAACTVLEHMLGNDVAFTDTTNAWRPKDDERNVSYISRRYNSFREFADECAVSRLYGGIHIQYDNEKGAEVGHDVALNVIQLFE